MDEQHPSACLTSVRSAYGCAELVSTVNDNTANFNVSGIKKYPEFINSEKLYSALNMNPGEPFLKICSQCCENNDFPSYDTADKQILDMLYQKMHFNFIDAQQRIKYLEKKLNKKKRIKLW